MDSEAFIDYPVLNAFADDVKHSVGWLLLQCGIPVGAASNTAVDAVSWNDDSIQFFAARWDQEIAAISSAVQNFVTGLREVGQAYCTTDDRLAGS